MVESIKAKFTVDEGGNKRSNISAEDIDQTLNDLNEWFKANAPKYHKERLEVARPASETEINKLASRDNFTSQNMIAVKSLYSRVNGGMQLQDTFQTLSTEEIAVTGTKEGMVPIGIDKENRNQIMCIQNGDKLVILDIEDQSTEDLNMDLAGYLEWLRNSLLSKKLIYDELLGLISLK